MHYFEPKEPVAPFIRQWDGYDHIHFLNWARKLYSQDKTGSRPPARKNRCHRYYCWHLAYRIWRIGRNHYVIKWNMGEFWKWLEPPSRENPSYRDLYSRPHGSYWNNQKRCWVNVSYRDWYPKNGAHYRCKVPLRITGKKVRSEKYVQREEWRKASGHYRDKAKRRHWKRSAPLFFKQESATVRRMYEKQFVHNGDWDNQLTELRRDFIDPWRWD